MSGFSQTIELRAARPPWGLPVVAGALLLAAAAVLISDLPPWLRLAAVAALALACARHWHAVLRGRGIAPGIAAIWLTPAGDWRLVLDTGELQRAELLHGQGFVTRALVGLTFGRDRPGKRRIAKLRVWLTPAMLSAADWRRLQVRLRNP